MPGLRRHRRWLSRWLAAVLLFAQLATAAYACPQVATALGDDEPAAAAATAAMAAMPGCTGTMPDGLDPDQPQLCKAHCEAGQTSVNSQPAAPDPMLDVGAALVGLVVAAEAGPPPGRGRMAPAAGPPEGSPPLYLRLLVLRN